MTTVTLNPGMDKEADKLPVNKVILLFFLGVLLPTSVSVNLGGLRLSAYRVVLILAFIPMMVQLLSGKKGKMNIFDILVFLHCGWVFLALVKWGGVAQAIETGGIYTVEFAGAYFLGRLFIRTYNDYQAFARFFTTLMTVLLLFTLPEALTGIHILYDFFAASTGSPRAPFIEKRMGLERTFGPFDHPILYGVFSASAFSMAYFVIQKKNMMDFKGLGTTFGVCVATFVSASGGPYVVLVMQICVAAYERMLSKFKLRWPLLFSIFGITYFSIDMLSNRTPFHVFISHFTFSAQSAYNRINIWNYGTAEVGRHPLLGIGMGDWIRAPWMSDSMDNFWLLIAVRYGMPALVFLLCLMLGLLWVSGKRKDIPDSWKRARHAWAFTLFGITVAAATVHLWNALFVLFLFMMGSGAWLIDCPLPEKTSEPSEPDNDPPAPSRFSRGTPACAPSIARETFF